MNGLEIKTNQTGQDEPRSAKAGFWKRLFSKQL